MRGVIGRLRLLKNNKSGAAFVEMTLITPILIVLASYAFQAGLWFYTVSSMERAARTAARDLAALTADDETNGAMTDCASLTGTGSDGNTSAEQIACNALSSTFGNFFVSARDGTLNGLGVIGSDAIVTVEIDRSSILFLDALGIISSSGKLSAQVTMLVQN